MNLHSTFSSHIILNQTGLFAFFWSLESIHYRDEDHGRDEGVLNVLSRSQGDHHDGHKAKSLAVKSGLEIFWNCNGITREQTLVQYDKSKYDWLCSDDTFGWVTERSKETVDFWHL
jgi:nitrogen fixation-related uncharacterized protein